MNISSVTTVSQLMETNLEVWKEEGKEFSDIRVAWDWIKYNVRLFSVQYSKGLARIKREKEQSLQKKLQAAQIKSTKYFLSLEKRNHTRKHIRKLCLSGVITTNYEKNFRLVCKIL